MLALSTSWNNSPRKSAQQIFGEIENLGFEYIELGFSHTKKHTDFLHKHPSIKPLSLHNFCPIPDRIPINKALPDFYNLASKNESIRKTAVNFTKRTILTAKKLHAKAIVLHAGRVEIDDYTRELCKLKQRNNLKSLDTLRCKALEERNNNKKHFIDSIFKSLRDLTDFANNEGIKIGLENRFYIREIPNFEEIGLLLAAFHKKGLGYWHDAGHAYIFDQIGLGSHLGYLKKYHSYLLGVHLHDVKNLVDHMAPFTGEIDFRKFKPFIKNETIKIIEAHKPATAKEIIFAKQKLEKLFK